MTMATLPKRPALQWYPGDHRRDTALQACPYLARAIWRDMIDLMHDGTPYGHLTAGAQPNRPPGAGENDRRSDAPSGA